MSAKPSRRKRTGAIIVMTCCLLVAVLGFAALAVDVGYLQVASCELQRSADASAIAATWKLLDQQGPGSVMNSTKLDLVRSTAGQFAGLNPVCNAAPTLSAGDVPIGNLGYPYDRTVAITFSDPSRFNAVTVTVRRDASQNGEVPLFFARALGRESSALQAQATAAFLNDISGFKTPADGSNLDLLPFALDLPTWMSLGVGEPSDSYKWDTVKRKIVSGTGDGFPECNLYPLGTGSPGNRGTVDIGSSNNSTSDICRQIRYGISPSDMACIGGKLELDANGTVTLNGDTGISAGVKDDLASIIGKPRVIPIFSAVAGNGNNARYTIVGFGGVRIMHVKLTGANKEVIIQPAPIVVKGAIPNSGTTPVSKYVYSPVWLVR